MFVNRCRRSFVGRTACTSKRVCILSLFLPLPFTLPVKICGAGGSCGRRRVVRLSCRRDNGESPTGQLLVDHGSGQTFGLVGCVKMHMLPCVSESVWKGCAWQTGYGNAQPQQSSCFLIVNWGVWPDNASFCSDKSRRNQLLLVSPGPASL